MSRTAIKEVDYKPSLLEKGSFVEIVSLNLSRDDLNCMFVRFDKPENLVLDTLERTNSSSLARDGDDQPLMGFYQKLLLPDRCHSPPYGLRFHPLNSNFVRCITVLGIWHCNRLVNQFTN